MCLTANLLIQFVTERPLWTVYLQTRVKYFSFQDVDQYVLDRTSPGDSVVVYFFNLFSYSWLRNKTATSKLANLETGYGERIQYCAATFRLPAVLTVFSYFFLYLLQPVW